MKIGFLGDSLTAGYGVGKDRAYPALVKARFAQRGVTLEVVNAGVSGDTAQGGLWRAGPLLRAHSLTSLVVALGANDMLRGISPSETEKSLRTILMQAQALGVRPVLLGMRAVPFHGAAYQRQFDALYFKLSEELKVPLLPFFIEKIAGHPEYNQEDGLHPNEKGQSVLAETVFEFLFPLLCSLPGPLAGPLATSDLERSHEEQASGSV